MKTIYAIFFVSLGLFAQAQSSEKPKNWILTADYLMQSSQIETTIGTESHLISTNFTGRLDFARRIGKYIWLNAGTKTDNMVLASHRFTARTFELGFSLIGSSIEIKNQLGVSLLVGFSGCYKLLHGFKAPEGESILEPDNGVLGLSARFGVYVNAGRFSFGPVFNTGLDFKDFKFSNGETLKFKESAAIGFGFGYRF